MAQTVPTPEVGEYLCSQKAWSGLGVDAGRKLYNSHTTLRLQKNGKTFLLQPGTQTTNPLTLEASIDILESDPVLATIAGLSISQISNFFTYAKIKRDKNIVEATIDNYNGFSFTLLFEDNHLRSVRATCERD